MIDDTTHDINHRYDAAWPKGNDMARPTDEELEAMAADLEENAIWGLHREAVAMLRACKGRVRVKNIEPDDGFWNSCSGCHETNEGAETGFYPYSPDFQCYIGAGCRECGGIGAVWDNADYSDITSPASYHGEWDMDESEHSVLIYSLKQDGWHKGEPFMVNDVTIRIENANGSNHDLGLIAARILAALEPAPDHSDWNAAIEASIDEIDCGCDGLCLSPHACPKDDVQSIRQLKKGQTND